MVGDTHKGEAVGSVINHARTGWLSDRGWRAKAWDRNCWQTDGGRTNLHYHAYAVDCAGGWGYLGIGYGALHSLGKEIEGYPHARYAGATPCVARESG